MIILDERLKYLHKEFFDWKIFIIVTLITIIIGVIIALIIVAKEDILDMGEKILIFSVTMILIGLFGAGIGAVSAINTRCVASKRQYEIYLTDMSFEELVDSPNYIIVDTVGKKIIIEDKEWKYFEGYEE